MIINTLINKRRKELKKFGFTILDEAHKYVSKIFFRGLTKISSKYILGISATFKREDGLDKILNLYVGKTVLHLNDLYSGKIPQVQFHKYLNEKYTNKYYNIKTKMLDATKMQKQLFSDPQRKKYLIDLILDNIDRDQIMVLLSHTKYIDEIYNEIKNINNDIRITKLYSDTILDTDAKIILATRNSGGIGINIKNLDTLIIATTFKKGKFAASLNQAIGRILRKNHEKPPLIIDIWDQHNFYLSHGEKRKEYYTKRKFIIQKIYDIKMD